MTAEEAKTPGRPKSPFINEVNEPRYWTLYYRYGNIMQLTKGFKLDGNLNDAIIRGRKHCEIMAYRFIGVRPMVVDLDFQEEQYLNGKYQDQGRED